MDEVDGEWKWKVGKYWYYENVGVEDLRFVGDGVDDFEDDGRWIEDGG